ncbi:hypothetical protein [Terrimonas alba]|uniref:hypothetical protein n=1 Tax=Terrimonas alba TaxID=3349636 RepID=UPI0035F23D42
MTRDAKLYYLRYLDWKPLVEQIEQHKNYSLKHLITVFKTSLEYPPTHSYTLLSMDSDIDKMIESYGGIEAAPNDLMRNALHHNTPDTLYGEKSSVIYLNKI